MSGTLFLFGTLLAVATGSAGFVLSVLAWQIFRGAPFGDALFVLVLFMASFTIYHAALALWPALPVSVLAVESLAFLLVVVFAFKMMQLHRRGLRVNEEGADE
ncbi:hypothetical protein JCM17823_08730 [Halorubrum gandharaense]